MPSFFSFEQGNESRARHTDASPLLGRYRAVPTSTTSNRRGSLGLLTRGSWRNSVHVGHGYGALLAAGLGGDGSSNSSDNSSENDDDEDRMRADDESRLVRWCRKKWRRKVRDVWITPKQGAVRRISAVWYSRWFVLVVMPAALAVAWCAIPFPQYPLNADDDWDGHIRPPTPGNGSSIIGDPPKRHKTPGHGEAKVEVNFWFFVFVYYGFYNITALMWITKVFNLYSLNWWPSRLGFPLTMAIIAILGTCGPIVLYYIPEAKFLTIHNTVWIIWTFCIMAMPVMIASCILLTKERHMGLRHSLSETQRIFTSSWWAGDDDMSEFNGRGGGRAHGRRRNDPYNHLHPQLWQDPSVRDGASGNTLGIAVDQGPPSRVPVRLRHRFFPASFVRFVWFCTALFIGLLAYVIGEAYAEVYLRTLPHSSLDTIVYVYGWISTVYLLDGLTGWILGGNQGERVGSYPLSWVFKL